MRSFLTLLLGLFLAIAGISACKKKSDPPPNNNNTAPPVCNLPAHTLSVNDTLRTFQTDSGMATANNTYNTEHVITATEGLSLDFEGNAQPATGDYTITPVFIDVVPGSKKVYLQYFYDGQPYLGQGGTLHITSSGSGLAFDFCKVECKNTFGISFTVSAKGVIP